MNRAAFALPMVVALLLAGCIRPVARPHADAVNLFQAELERLRADLHIPGLSVAVLEDQRVIYARGFGFADVENQVLATAETPYEIASLTKPIATAALMQLVEAGQLDLDAEMADVLADTEFIIPGWSGKPIEGYAELCGVARDRSRAGAGANAAMAYAFGDYRCDSEPITVRHHLTHTAQGLPGDEYRYSGFLFYLLSWVAETTARQPFEKVLIDRIVTPLRMTGTLPNKSASRRQEILAATAKPYAADGAGNVAASNYVVEGVAGAAAGMVSTVLDLAKFDIALDRNLLVSHAAKAAMFSPALARDGRALPYGLGWFVQDHAGAKLAWHYGYQPGAYSSLILKAPEQELTLILLANSDGASAGFNLDAGDVRSSPFAAAFLDLFVDRVGTAGRQ